MKQYCWIYFRDGYGQFDVDCVFLNHHDGLEYIVDELININPDYKDTPLHKLYDQANADLHKCEVKR